MIYPMYVIRDTKVGFDPQIILQMNEQSAVRGFQFMMSNENSMQGKFPADYELYKIGDYDTDSGIVDPVNPPKFIVNGGTIIEK